MKSIKSCHFSNKPIKDGYCLGRDNRCKNCTTFIDFLPDIVYIATTSDRYELPVFVTDEVIELAEKTGVSRSTISTAISRNHERRNSEYKFVKVYIGGE